MRPLMLALAAAVALLMSPVSSPGGAAAIPALVVNPGAGAGDLTSRTSEAQLVRRFGRRNVLRASVPIGQGEQEPGTILFPRDARQTIVILWKSQTQRVSPKHARVRGEDSVWSVGPGVRLGLSLEELET